MLASATDTTSRIVVSPGACRDTRRRWPRQAGFPFEGPQKTRWSNLPSPLYERQGLRLADLTPPQRAAAMALVATALSQPGYQKVEAIMQGDEVLRTQAANGRGGGGRAGGRAPGRGPSFGKDEGPDVAFVGTPSTTQPWTLQFGGHHLAMTSRLAGAKRA